jgi:hypothetical protein
MALPDLNLYYEAVSDAFWKLWRGNLDSYVNLKLVLYNFTDRLNRHERIHKYEIALHAIMVLLVTLAFILLIHDDAICFARSLGNCAVKKWSKDGVRQVDGMKREREVKG